MCQSKSTHFKFVWFLKFLFLNGFCNLHSVHKVQEDILTVWVKYTDEWVSEWAIVSKFGNILISSDIDMFSEVKWH